MRFGALIHRVVVVAGARIALATAVLASSGCLFDSFDVAGTTLDPTFWTTEIGPSSFLGRTQLRNWVSQSPIGPFVVAGSSAELALDTYNPTAGIPGASFFGTQAKSQQTFLPMATADQVFSTRLRLTTVQPGLVFGLYLFGCAAGPCQTHHDEIDIELVTNFLQPGAPLRVQLNRYKEEALGAGHGSIVNLPAGFDPLDWHVWTIRWGLNRIAYFVDGRLLFEAFDIIPQLPMSVNAIAWAPDSGWPDAYHATLQPAATSGQNQRFVGLLDYVSVREVHPNWPATGGSIDLNLHTDRIADILLQNGSNWIGGFLMDGKGRPESFIHVYPGDTGGWRAAGTLDLNSDGITDILLQNSANWIAAFLMNGNGQPVSFIYIHPGDTGGWRVVGTLDLNKDGVGDILLQNSANWLAAFLMNGSGQPVSFINVYPGDTGGWIARATADLNGDGCQDIVLQHVTTSWLGALAMDCQGVPTEFQYVYQGSTEGWQVAGTADLNGDGITDLLLQNSDSWIATFLMDGNGRPSRFEYVYPGSTGGWRVVGGR